MVNDPTTDRLSRPPLWAQRRAWQHRDMNDQQRPPCASEPPASSLTLDMAAVAALIRVSEPTINRWAKAGTMPAYRVGRSWIAFRPELDAWLASTSTDATGSTSLPSLRDMLAALPPLLRLADAAELLHVSQATVAALITDQQLVAVNLGSMRRVPVEALRVYLSAARNAA